MKLLIGLLFSFRLFSAELGEDPSNVDCIKNVHGSRPFLASIKKPLTEDQEEEVKTKEIKTRQK